jgi:hypothetical protein
LSRREEERIATMAILLGNVFAGATIELIPQSDVVFLYPNRAKAGPTHDPALTGYLVLTLKRPTKVRPLDMGRVPVRLDCRSRNSSCALMASPTSAPPPP